MRPRPPPSCGSGRAARRLRTSSVRFRTKTRQPSLSVLTTTEMPLQPDLLEIVRCPKCLGRVAGRAPESGEGLACGKCKLLYPIVDDIPNFLVEEAQPLDG